jgi:hypothetical protein
MFPVRYELNSYILFRRNSVFKGLMITSNCSQWSIFLNAEDLLEARHCSGRNNIISMKTETDWKPKLCVCYYCYYYYYYYYYTIVSGLPPVKERSWEERWIIWSGNHKGNEGTFAELKTKPEKDYSKHYQENWRIPRSHFKISVQGEMIKRASDEEMQGKPKTLTGLTA